MSPHEVMYCIGISEDGKAYLAHHGIKGQKWGVRRFQNTDGSLTKAGLKRYHKDEIQRDPYGHGAKATAEQRNRRTKDIVKYGQKGFNRIKGRIESGKTYNKAKLPEDIKRSIAAVAGLYISDLYFFGGAATRTASYAARRGAAKAAKSYATYKAGKAAAKRVLKLTAGNIVNVKGVILSDEIID